MDSNDFMDYVAGNLGQKLGRLPGNGRGACYNSPRSEFVDGCARVGLQSHVCAEHVNGADFRWGVERVVRVPNIKYGGQAEELKAPIQDLGVVGYLQRGYPAAPAIYSYFETDFSTVTSVAGAVPEGITVGLPLEGAIELSIAAIKKKG